MVKYIRHFIESYSAAQRAAIAVRGYRKPSPMDLKQLDIATISYPDYRVTKSRGRSPELEAIPVVRRKNRASEDLRPLAA